MGQSASRTRRSLAAAEPASSSSSSPAPARETTAVTPAEPAHPARSTRGHKWRRSLMGLVTPSHAYPERKSWMRKKDKDGPPAPSSSSSPSDKEEEPSHERPATPFPSMMSALAVEGRTEEDEEADDGDDEWAAEPSSGDAVVDNEPEERHGEVDDDELLRQLLNPLPPPSPPPPEIPPPPLPSQPRQFPPPGTLVVVQGVVHTTDIPRTNISAADTDTDPPTSRPRALSTPRSSTPNNTRNRLSTLLRSRPASMNVNAPSPEEHEAPSPTHAHASGSTISSSSIDVLGTLLSVAAAATAASLLTGSSEPVLSPSPPSPSALHDPWLSRPPPSLGLNDSSNRAERMRQAWGSIRERLGLRSAPGPGVNTPTPSHTSDISPSSAPIVPTTFGGLHVPRTPVDPREVMLAEMARAFNIGFGIPGSGGSAGDPESRPTSTLGSEGAGTHDGPGANSPAEVAELPLPDEGSFERFLIDLQVDLRVALTRGDDEEHAEGGEDTHGEPNGGPWSPPNQTADDMDSIPALASVSDSSDDGDTSDEEYHTDAESHRRDSDDPLDAAFAFNTGQADSSDRRAPFPEPPSRPSTIPNINRPPIQPTGQINWWRLYRFPAIIDPQIPPSATGTGAGQVSNPIVPTLTHSSPISLPLTTSPTDHPTLTGHTASTSPSIPSSTTPPVPTDFTMPNTVIPVIVVGLQSVQLNWRRDASGTPIPPLETETDQGDPDGTPSLDTDTGTAGNPHGRGWQTRAADAIRSLRPATAPRGAIATPSDGEDGEERQGPMGAPGSRTFLIYVIGGYYPPDHSIVTGGPNNLDSFEALLELAELLGQVKPPTASKEDIEKSGLEVIHADMLYEYEQSGKISENCTERCLICLDEYIPEEEIRVLKCRHAFHMGCVDKWLQTGKNNCPACRSRGVPTESHIPRAGDL